MIFFWRAMLNTNGDLDRFKIDYVNVLLCRNLQDKSYIFIKKES